MVRCGWGGVGWGWVGVGGWGLGVGGWGLGVGGWGLGVGGRGLGVGGWGLGVGGWGLGVGGGGLGVGVGVGGGGVGMVDTWGRFCDLLLVGFWFRRVHGCKIDSVQPGGGEPKWVSSLSGGTRFRVQRETTENIELFYVMIVFFLGGVPKF